MASPGWLLPHDTRLSSRKPAGGGLMARFFGRDGRGQLSLRQFADYVASLREELVRLEFKHYDWQGKVGVLPLLWCWGCVFLSGAEDGKGHRLRGCGRLSECVRLG